MMLKSLLLKSLLSKVSGAEPAGVVEVLGVVC